MVREHLLGLLAQRRAEGAAGVEAERDAVVLGGDRGPRAGAHRDEVGGERAASSRAPTGPARPAVPHRCPRCSSAPARLTRTVYGRLEVGLVEAGEHPRRGVEEEVAVDVVLVVGGVGGAVQALAVVPVGHRRLDLEDVLGGEVGEREPAVDEGGGVERLAVEGRGVQGDRSDVGEGRRRPARRSGSRTVRGSEVLRPPVEVEVDLMASTVSRAARATASSRVRDGHGPHPTRGGPATGPHRSGHRRRSRSGHAPCRRG